MAVARGSGLPPRLYTVPQTGRFYKLLLGMDGNPVGRFLLGVLVHLLVDEPYTGTDLAQPRPDWLVGEAPNPTITL